MSYEKESPDHYSALLQRVGAWTMVQEMSDAQSLRIQLSEVLQRQFSREARETEIIMKSKEDEAARLCHEAEAHRRHIDQLRNASLSLTELGAEVKPETLILLARIFPVAAAVAIRNVKEINANAEGK